MDGSILLCVIVVGKMTMFSCANSCLCVSHGQPHAGWCLYEKPTDLQGDECEDGVRDPSELQGCDILLLAIPLFK